MITVKIKRAKDAKLPAYAHKGDSGVDLYATEDMMLEPMKIGLIPTGISIAIPEGYEAQIRPKSGLALNHGIAFVNSPGTIDSGYRGEVKIIAINLGAKPYHVEKGKKIAQMVFAKVEHANFLEVGTLDETARNHGGFGSTGLQ